MQHALLQEEILSALTETERRIVEAYLQHRGRARDLARALGVSERTVYKALYKYRKLARERGIDPSAFYLRGGGAHQLEAARGGAIQLAYDIEYLKRELLAELIPVIEDAVKQAVVSTLRGAHPAPQHTAAKDAIYIASDQINRLIASIERLNDSIVKFNMAISSLHSYSLASSATRGTWQTTTQDGSLPSFVIDNPWLEVLSRSAR